MTVLVVDAAILIGIAIVVAVHGGHHHATTDERVFNRLRDMRVVAVLSLAVLSRARHQRFVRAVRMYEPNEMKCRPKGACQCSVVDCPHWRVAHVPSGFAHHTRL